MTLKSDAKFKEKLTCGFKHDMRNGPPSKPFLSQGKSFAPLQIRTTPKTPPSFYVNPPFF